MPQSSSASDLLEMAAETSGFVYQRRIGFGDCDAAAIAFTGRLCEITLEALEAFWCAATGQSGWTEMVTEHGLGSPVVKLEHEFHHPVLPRWMLDCDVQIERLGETSVTYRLEARQNGTSCFSACVVMVFTDVKSMQKIPIPPRIRSALAKRLAN